MLKDPQIKIAVLGKGLLKENPPVENMVNVGEVDRIEQYIQLGDVCQSPFSIALQGSTLNYGWNQVYFQASDIAGNLSPHAFIWLYRLNRNYLPLVISP